MIQIELKIDNGNLTLNEALKVFEKLFIEQIKKHFNNDISSSKAIKDYIKAGSDGYIFKCEILPKGTSRKLSIADEMVSTLEVMINDFKSK